MCDYCNGGLKTIIESSKISNLVWFLVNKENISGSKCKDYIDEIPNNVCIEIRNGQGYIRLGDPEDMNCIGHGENFKINFCPMCGNKIS